MIKRVIRGIALIGGVLIGILVPVASFGAGLEIQAVSVDPMTTAHLCRALGGQGKDPRLTIRHDKVGGAKIVIKMYDNVSSGNTVNHFSTSVKSSASGVTVVRYNFRPPCNTTGRSISSYKFSVKSGRSKRIVKWARYNSARKQILK